MQVSDLIAFVFEAVLDGSAHKQLGGTTGAVLAKLVAGGGEDRAACERCVTEPHATHDEALRSSRQIPVGLPCQILPCAAHRPGHRIVCMHMHARRRCMMACAEDFLTASPHAAAFDAKRAQLLLKALYDKDAASEEAILRWHDEGAAGGAAAARLREMVAPFIAWLRASDDEESD